MGLGWGESQLCDREMNECFPPNSPKDQDKCVLLKTGIVEAGGPTNTQDKKKRRGKRRSHQKKKEEPGVFVGPDQERKQGVNIDSEQKKKKKGSQV